MSALTFATAQLLRAVPRAHVSRAFGRLADHKWSAPLGRAVVGLYSRLYDVRFDECEEREGWSSFDHFFTRRLKGGARPMADDPSAVVSPADGRVESMGRIDANSTFVVKGRPYSVAELVGDDTGDEARRFVGGGGCVVYLSPRDYHRVHAPVGGIIRHIRSIPGDYYPVNSIGLRHVPNLFARNRRVAIAIDTPAGHRVTVIMVVAMIVGRITVTGVAERDVPMGDHAFDPPMRVARGDEIGIFHLGSTAVVLVEASAFGDGARWAASEGPVMMGQALVALAAPAGKARQASVNGRRA